MAVRTAMVKLRWGICSAGNISFDYANALKSVSDNNLIVAVGARKLESAKTFAAKFNIPNVHGSYEDLAKDPEVQVVYIGTLITNHCSLTKMFLEHGKHVLVEKPLAMNAAEARDMIQVAREKKLFFMEGVWARFNPVYTNLRKSINDGVLGNVRIVQANFHVPIGAVDRIIRKELGGGATQDIGVYVVNIAQFVFQEKPEKIEATGTLYPTGVDEAANITLHYSGGRMAHLSIHSNVDGLVSSDARIVGDKGSIKIEAPFWTPETSVLSRQEKVVDTFVSPTPTNAPFPFNFKNSGNFVYQIEAVRKAIEAGKCESDVMPMNDSITMQEIRDEIRKKLGSYYEI